MELCCVICLENEKKKNMIEYNHCGKYYIHSFCLNKWTVNDCFICRQQIIPEIVSSNNIILENTIENTIENTTQPRIRHRNKFIRFILWFFCK